MSRPGWAPQPDHLKLHPQLAALAALDHQLHIASSALAAVHGGGEYDGPVVHQARAIAGVARTLQSQIDAYRRLLTPQD